MSIIIKNPLKIRVICCNGEAIPQSQPHYDLNFLHPQIGQHHISVRKQIAQMYKILIFLLMFL